MGAKLNGGDPITKLSAREWNRHCDVGDWYERTKRMGDGGPGNAWSFPGTIAKVRNDSSGALASGDVVELGASLLTTLERQIILSANVRSGDGVCGVVIDDMPYGDTGLGRVQVSGLCVASVDIVDADNTHARVVPSSLTLKGDFGGYARILYKPSGTGVKSCVVLLGHHQTIIRKARSTSTITASGSGTANIYINGSSVGSVTVYYDWMTGGGDIATSKDILIQYFHDQDQWVVIGAACA